jgi:acyl-CoA synthetase (NDP forming)
VANPLDMLGSATVAHYARVLPLLLADPRVDALIVLFVPPVTAGGDEVATAVDNALAAEPPDKPVLAVLLGARVGSQHVARFDYPESAARALGRAADRAEWLRRPAGAEVEVGGVDLAAARAVVAAAPDGWLTPEQTRTLLGSFGIPVVPESVAEDAEGAVAAAAELGYPVVVKSAVAGAHKTESGGVAVDVRGADEVRAAAERIGPPVLVQPFVKGGAELLAGVVQDRVFGPLVAFGPGGIYAELIGDAGFRITPLTDVDAEELVTSGKAGRLVSGFRGRPAADPASLTDLLHRLSRLGEDFPQVAELDLNPVVGLTQGCVAVDARVRVHRSEPQQHLKTW